MAVLVGISGFVLPQLSRRREQHDAEARRFVSRLLRDFNVSYERGPANLCEEYLERNKSFLQMAGTNSGAELMHACYPVSPWTSDTDSDGLIEASDDRGNPLIFLPPTCSRDVVVASDGQHHAIASPPYRRSHSYLIIRLDDYCWFDDEQYSTLAAGGSTTQRSE